VEAPVSEGELPTAQEPGTATNNEEQTEGTDLEDTEPEDTDSEAPPESPQANEQPNDCVYRCEDRGLSAGQCDQDWWCDPETNCAIYTACGNVTCDFTCEMYNYVPGHCYNAAAYCDPYTGCVYAPCSTYSGTCSQLLVELYAAVDQARACVNTDPCVHTWLGAADHSPLGACGWYRRETADLARIRQLESAYMLNCAEDPSVFVTCHPPKELGVCTHGMCNPTD